MSNYTPTEGQMLTAWLISSGATRMTASHQGRFKAEFDRFIAQIKADAWDEAYNATCDAHDVYGGMNYEPRNPYRKANDE